ncbi:hypothetical protein GLAREA_08814 [Glarea lozoyensis ATCC 20868]|uniref:Uncharacterized protein n=1 Tax=Glarea lozoyensis (strain ATCC 20868 / MF5171) TaxID=1116229 RepID=S3DXI4_GLAL2|nr:uncharacterized protein GLAREA_08814 [Glarea lozoyensis ATCC 20868]EPE36651.1 hypothetical protein GLAREA_08814 [Glarea lozoyensis ATCC 20868]
MAVSVASRPGFDSTTHRLGSSLETISADDTSLTAAIKDNVLSNINTKYNDEENFLIVSPYEEKPHLLDLRTLDTTNQLLAKALVGLKCVREDYSTAPYIDIFNWPEVVDSVHRMAELSDFKWTESSFYIVVFRSRIPPTTVYADLGVLDKAAHAEATESGGFLKYWFGSPDGHGRNLATCVWRSPHDARVGSVGEAHRKAAGATRSLYTEWKIERLRLLIKDDAQDWEISEWVD